MARSFAEFGNAIYTGEKSIDFVGRRKIWYTIAAVLLIIAVVGPFLRGGFTFGLDFTGGSQFQVHLSQPVEDDQTIAEEAIVEVLPASTPRVSHVGQADIRVQLEALDDADTAAVNDALVGAFDVTEDDVTYSFVGPAWGQDITQQALVGIAVFLLFAALIMAIYFRTWKMALAALMALLHDLIITAGVYGIMGFEVTPAALIGLLTILGYSLYDTVVVFDKIRENTAPGESNELRTFSESVNLAVNQTLVRSINTSVVGLLPVGSILFIGAFILGAGTLRDISLALFIGILVGAYSTIFIAAPVYAQIRGREDKIKRHDERVHRLREKNAADGAKEDAEAETESAAGTSRS
ncbi:MAG: protein translocase subunit SecF [Leucobacter sp.]